MRNQSIYNIINSSKLMDQVFNKYDIYRKTYFGNIEYTKIYDFTKSISAYEKCQVRTNQTANGLYKKNNLSNYSWDDGLKFTLSTTDDKMGLELIKSNMNKLSFTLNVKYNGNDEIHSIYMYYDSSLGIKNALFKLRFISGVCVLSVLNANNSTYTEIDTFKITQGEDATFTFEFKDNYFILNGTTYDTISRDYSNINRWKLTTANKTSTLPVELVIKNLKVA